MPTISKYRRRYWAVHVDGVLLAVVLYKKGAIAIRDMLFASLQPTNHTIP